jgi:rsbT antagonist protein RsbS
MDSDVDIPRIPMQVTHGCLVASVQVDLNDAVLQRFETELLHKIRETQVKGVIFDVSGLDLMDAHEFTALRKCMSMAHLMGTEPVIVGLNAGIASSLVDLDVDTTGLTATRTMERAFDVLTGQILSPTGS